MSEHVELEKLVADLIKFSQTDSKETKILMSSLCTEIKIISNTLKNDRENRTKCFDTFADHEARLRSAEQINVSLNEHQRLAQKVSKTQDTIQELKNTSINKNTDFKPLVAKVENLQKTILIATGTVGGVWFVITVIWPKLIDLLNVGQ